MIDHLGLTPELPHALTCREFVEFVTAYLEGTLPLALRQAFDAHWAECEGCQHYLAQIRQTLALLHRLPKTDHSATDLEGPLAVFRVWRRNRPGL